MSDVSHGTGKGPAHRDVEIGVATICVLFGLLIMWGSYKAGINWGVEGPRSGFFPFYVGLIIVVCSAITLTQTVIEKGDGLFAEWSQLRSVLQVVIPTAIYVAVMPALGIYVTSIVLIGGFMKWFGQYDWLRTLLVAVGVPVATYLMFEKWFLVPLPKGPLEAWLGL